MLRASMGAPANDQPGAWFLLYSIYTAKGCGQYKGLVACRACEEGVGLGAMYMLRCQHSHPENNGRKSFATMYMKDD